MYKTVALLLLVAASCYAQEAKEFEVIGTKRVTIDSPFKLRVPAGYTFYGWSSSPLVKLEGHRITSAEVSVTAPVGTHDVSCDAVRLDIVDNQIKPQIDPFAFSFTVGQTGTDPGEPDKPPPTVDLEALQKISAQGIKQLNDAATAAALHKALANERFNPNDTLQSLYAQGNRAVSKALLSLRLDKDWYQFWRKPVNDWIKVNVKTSVGYVAAINALMETLESARLDNLIRSAARLDPHQDVVKMYTRKGCEPCEQWEEEVAPTFVASGFQVKYIPTQIGRTPRYEIRFEGKSYSWQDYLTLSMAHELLERKVIWKP